jgi:radical SAM superfamily enzyme YgiQ (UPF0313 family)
MFIHQNISAACTLLDFPTREEFVRELTSQQYDIVGISSIVVNVGKVREMCRLVRRHSPRSTIVVGGHVTSVPKLETLIDADHIVRGDGVSWMRRFLGEETDRPLIHPLIPSSFDFRVMGLPSPRGGGSPAATIVPSVGCPLGCNFCTTSAFFGGKGRFINYSERGQELFRVMCEAEGRLGVSSFFMMDENFLLYKRRALELLERMKAHNKSWALYVFSSANAIRKYDIRQLVELGVEWIWLGLESSETGYAKLKGSDTLSLVRELQSHGICVHGSTIIGLEHHTPENIGSEIERAISHDTVFHQFMLYTPMPGRRCTRRSPRRDACCPRWTAQTRTVSSNSISSIRRLVATTRRCCSTARSGSISSATDRACSAHRARARHRHKGLQSGAASRAAVVIETGKHKVSGRATARTADVHRAPRGGMPLKDRGV